MAANECGQVAVFRGRHRSSPRDGEIRLGSSDSAGRGRCPSRGATGRCCSGARTTGAMSGDLPPGRGGAGPGGLVVQQPGESADPDHRDVPGGVVDVSHGVGSVGADHHHRPGLGSRVRCDVLRAGGRRCTRRRSRRPRTPWRSSGRAGRSAGCRWRRRCDRRGRRGIRGCRSGRSCSPATWMVALISWLTRGWQSSMTRLPILMPRSWAVRRSGVVVTATASGRAAAVVASAVARPQPRGAAIRASSTRACRRGDGSISGVRGCRRRVRSRRGRGAAWGGPARSGSRRG